MTRTLAVLAFLAACFASPAARAADGGFSIALGSRCRVDADCGATGLFCMTASNTELGGRGPAGGVCTVGCVSETECAPWDPDASCINFGGPAFCFEGCTKGDDYTAGFDSGKCHGRDDMACTGSERGLDAPACIPTCTGDAQCGGGLHCNGSWALCEVDSTEGSAVGTTCDPSANPPTCKGYCSSFPNGASYCSAYCVYGGETGCGYEGSGARTAACLNKFTGGGDSVGDLGGCTELCNCDADCHAAGFLCMPNSLAGPLGKLGTCFPDFYVSASIPSCAPPPDIGACVYGEVRSCRGEGGCLGTAHCLANRSGYDPCRCLGADASHTADAAGPDSGPPPPADAGEEPRVDAGPPDAGEPPKEGGDGGAPRPSVAGITPPSGCNCRSASGPSSFPAGVAFVAASIAFLTRRIRRDRNRGG